MQVPAIQTLDSAMHQIIHYPVDKYYGNQLLLHYPWVEIYPVYNAIHLEQLGPDFFTMSWSMLFSLSEPNYLNSHAERRERS